MKIVVYGLGKNGREFIEDVLEANEKVEIVAVTDTFKQQTEFTQKYNITYMEPSCVYSIIFDYIVITPEKYFNEIKEFLIGQGVENKEIKSMEDFHKQIGSLYCEVCGNPVLIWKRVVEWRERCLCHICGSIHRNRFVYHVIKNYTDLLDGVNHSVLHFAPEGFAKEIKSICGENEYITVDITPGRADFVADITDLQFSDEHFEYIICNHVMEHVVNDKKGFAEMGRVLKPEVTLIFSVPIHWDKETLEDENIKSDEDRRKYYGQEDHVRYYGKDIIERLRRAGFSVQILFSNEIMNEDEINKFGCLSGDSVFLCKKNNDINGDIVL